MRWPLLQLMQRDNYSDRVLGGLALAISIASGATFNAFAKSLGTALSALSLLFVSELLTAVFIIISFGLLPVCKRVMHFTRHELIWLSVIALFTGVIGPMLLFVGLAHTTAVNAGFFWKIQIIFLMILAHIFLKEKITKAHYSAMAVMFVGIILIVFHGFSERFSFQYGDIYIIASALFYGTASMVFRTQLHWLDSHIVLFVRSLVAIMMFFAISPFISHTFITEIRAMPSAVFPALLGFALISRYLNSVTYFEAIDRLPISTVSLISSLEIVGATLFSYLYLGESILWYHYVGGAFVIAGSIMLELLGTHQNDKQLEQHLKNAKP